MDERWFTVPAALAGRRADLAAAGELDLSRSAAQRLISEGRIVRILPDGSAVPVRKNESFPEGTVFRCDLPDPVPCEVLPEDIPLDVRYEDDDVIVINKPKGMVVHPAPGHETGTLVSALLHYCGSSLSGIGGVNRPGIVHRIDRNTTGLVAVAKNDMAHAALALQLSDHSMHRVYEAILVGCPREDSGTVDAPIGRHPTDRKRMAVIPGGKNAREAVTHYELEERLDGCSLVRLRLETGRTHQIRVHMAYIGHPVLGDDVYGGDRWPAARKYPALLEGQCLHAGELVFRHPRTGETVTVRAPRPEPFEKLLEILRQT